ncbi:MAG: hypothetical protein QOD34_3182 [Mycobacterium sp.]|jgi:hypothetical protein|nr:hypothetical protein [Mycobacterium sp.]
MGPIDLLSAPFRWGSAIRGRKIFHPDGVLADGTIERLAPDDVGLPVPSADVVARVSKAAGTPGILPDAIGLAFRIPAQEDWPSDWDVLLASAGSGPIGRAVGLRPVTSWTGPSLSSLAPLRYRDANWWMRARITTRIDGFGLSLDSVRDRLECNDIVVEIDQARGTSPFEPLARATLTALRREQDLSFDPVQHKGPGVDMYPGWLADLRAAAYDRSRKGRAAG